MTVSIANYELRITNIGFVIKRLALLGVLCFFAGNIFAQTLEDLSVQIRRGDTEQKRDALLQIRNLASEPASRLAVPALKDSSEIVRATATFSVVFLPKDEAAQTLLPLLKDKSALVRRETAYALGKVGNSLAVNPLLQIFQKDKIAEVRNAAVVALGEIGDVAALAELVKILQRKPQTKEDFLRRSAARSIGQIAQIIRTAGVEVLTPENSPPDELKNLPKPKYPNLPQKFPVFQTAIAVLIQTLRNRNETGDTKRESAFALGKIGDQSAVPALQNNLDSPDYYLAEISRKALEEIQKLNN